MFYISAIDVPASRMTREDYEEMCAQPNLSTSVKLPGILLVFVGILPPRIVRGTPVTVVDIELHPKEPPLQGRPATASHGCVLLHFMPK